MSHTKHTLTCPYCGEQGEFAVWSNVNVMLNPELKPKVLDRSLFTFACPHCGKTAKVSYDCLYHDVAQEYMVYLVTTEASEADTYAMIMQNWSNAMVQQMVGGENYRLRIVHSQEELVEKILLFDAGRDDRVVELCKVLSLLNMQAQGMEFSDEVRLLYFQSDGKELLQIIDGGEIKGSVDIPPSMYDGIQHNFAKWLVDAPKNNVFIDAKWAVYVARENKREQHKRVCVYGSGDYDAKTMQTARELGRLIGGNGASLTYGGFGDGILGEVAKGVYETGGYILGILPAQDRAGHPTYAYCDRILRSPDKRERKRMQADNADVFIVLPDGIGVMDELFEVLVLKSYGQMHRRVIIFNMEHRYDTLLELLKEQNALSYVDVCETLTECRELLSQTVFSS